MTQTETVIVPSQWEPPMIPLAKIHPHPRNVRRDVVVGAEMVESVRAQGVLEPVILVPHAKKPGEYHLIAGHRRRAAARKAGLDEVPAIVRADLTDPAAQVAAMLNENGHRADLSPAEEADGYQALLDLGMDVKTIAKTTGYSQKTVRARVKVAAAPEDVKRRLHEREITLDEAMVLIEYPDQQEWLARYLGTSNWRWAVERVRENAAVWDRVGKLGDELRAQGFVVASPQERAELLAAADAREGVEHVWELAQKGEAYLHDDTDLATLINRIVPGWARGNTMAAVQVDVDSSAAAYAQAATYRLIPAVTAEPEPNQPDEASDVEDPGPADTGRTGHGRESSGGVSDSTVELDLDQVKQDLVTAAKARRGWLTERIRAGGDDADTHALLAELLPVMIAEHDAHDGAAALLGIDPEEHDVHLDEIMRDAMSLSTPGLALLLVAVWFAHDDSQLADPNAWGEGWRADQTGQWKQVLTRIGYEWSDIEERLRDQETGDAGVGE